MATTAKSTIFRRGSYLRQRHILGFFSAIAKQYGLSCKQTGDWEEVKRALSEGGLAIVSMHFGHFTSGGHYIVLVGVKSNNGVSWIDVFDFAAQ